MPRIKMTKSNIDALPTGKLDVVYWGAGRPCFGVKVTPKGPQSVRRPLSHRRRRIAITQVHDRALWPRDPPSGPSRGSEGLYRQAGGS